MQVRKLGFDKKSAAKSWKVKKRRRADRAGRKTSFEAKYTYSSSIGSAEFQNSYTVLQSNRVL